MRILVIRRDNIGDLVCTTPLFAALRARYPEAHLAALVNSYNAPALEGNPDLDAVHSYTKLKHRLPGESRLGILLARFRTLAKLRAEPFDYIVLAKAGYDRQGLSLARQLRRRHIVGFIDAGQRAPDAITVPVPAPHLSLHEVQAVHLLGRALDVSEAPGRLRVYPDPRRMEAWRSRLPGLKEGTWIAVHVSARQAVRRWATENWAQLVRAISARNGGRVLLLWAPGPSDDPRHPGDDERAAAILAQASGAVGAPTEELADLVAALALCKAFVGSDGGAMHIAAGLGLPIVAVFEHRPETKARWYPWQVDYEMVSSATADMGDLSVDQVSQAWARLATRVAWTA